MLSIVLGSRTLSVIKDCNLLECQGLQEEELYTRVHIEQTSSEYEEDNRVLLIKTLVFSTWDKQNCLDVWIDYTTFGISHFFKNPRQVGYFTKPWINEM